MRRADEGQGDLFAPAPPPQLFDPAPSRAELVQKSDARLEAWEAERALVAEGVEKGRAAGKTRAMLWGTAAKVAPAAMIPFGSGGWRLELIEHEGAVFAREELTLHNSGASGPWWRIEGARTLEEGALERARNRLEDCAIETRTTTWEEKRGKQYAELAAWIIAQFPPLLTGVDLAQEYEAKRATFIAREALRCAAIRAGLKDYHDEKGRELSIYSIGDA